MFFPSVSCLNRIFLSLYFKLKKPHGNEKCIFADTRSCFTANLSG